MIKKVALDQLLFAPCAIAGLTTAVWLLEGRAIREINDKLKNEYFSILSSNYKVSEVNITLHYFISTIIINLRMPN